MSTLWEGLWTPRYLRSRGSLHCLPVPVSSSLARAALAYLCQRWRLLVRLERVNAAVSRWDEWQARAYMPEGLWRDVPTPTLSRQALDGLHRMLVEELARLDGSEAGGG